MPWSRVQTFGLIVWRRRNLNIDIIQVWYFRIYKHKKMFCGVPWSEKISHWNDWLMLQWAAPVQEVRTYLATREGCYRRARLSHLLQTRRGRAAPGKHHQRRWMVIFSLFLFVPFMIEHIYRKLFILLLIVDHSKLRNHLRVDNL